jgi:hypothetical protein
MYIRSGMFYLWTVQSNVRHEELIVLWPATSIMTHWKYHIRVLRSVRIMKRVARQHI